MSGSGGVLGPANLFLQKSRKFWRQHPKNIFQPFLWELAKLVEKKRLGLTIHPLIWIKRSLQEGNIRVVELTPEIAVESTIRLRSRIFNRQLIQGPGRVVSRPALNPRGLQLWLPLVQPYPAGWCAD